MKYAYAAIAAVIVAVLAVVAYFVVAASAAPTAANGDNVSVYYKGSFTNGTAFQSNFGGQPLNFTIGANQVIAGFNNAIIGMSINQTKNVTIPMNEAYGPVNPKLFVSVPVNAFGNQTTAVGQSVSERTANGFQMTGIVTKVNATNVTIDFNPPLAGHDLIFMIKVVGIKK